MSTAIEIEHSIGHNSYSNSLYFHPNGENYIFASGWNVGIGSLLDPHSQNFLRGHNCTITCLTLSPSGNLIASGQKGESADVIIWNYNTGESIYKFEEHDYYINSVAFSHDEKLIASLGNEDDDKLILWDLSNGCIVTSASRLPKGTLTISFGGFVKDIKKRNTMLYQLCSGSLDGVTLWHLDPYEGAMTPIKVTGDSRATINRHITHVTFSTDEHFVFGATTSGDFMIIDPNGKRIVKSVMAAKKGLTSIVGYKQGVITGGGDGTVKVHSNTFEVISETTLDGPVISLAVSADLLEVLASTSVGSIFRINISKMNYIAIAESHTNSVLAASYSSTIHDRFATASLDGTIRVWDILEYATIAIGGHRPHQAKEAFPTCLCFAEIVITGWSDGSIMAYDPDTGKNLWYIESAHAGGVTAIKQSHNFRFILSGGMNGDVRLWELRSREMVSHLKEHTQKISDIQIFADDTQALTSSKDRSIMQWDLKGERRRHGHIQRMGGINGIALSKDQTQIMSVGQERKLTFWETHTPSPVHETPIGEDDSEEGLCIAKSQDGEYIATGSNNGIIRIWNFQTGQLLASTRAHSGQVTGISFSHDDRQILSSGLDGCVIIWTFFK